MAISIAGSLEFEGQGRLLEGSVNQALHS